MTARALLALAFLVPPASAEQPAAGGRSADSNALTIYSTAVPGATNRNDSPEVLEPAAGVPRVAAVAGKSADRT